MIGIETWAWGFIGGLFVGIAIGLLMSLIIIGSAKLVYQDEY